MWAICSSIRWGGYSRSWCRMVDAMPRNEWVVTPLFAFVAIAHGPQLHAQAFRNKRAPHAVPEKQARPFPRRPMLSECQGPAWKEAPRCCRRIFILWAGICQNASLKFISSHRAPQSSAGRTNTYGARQKRCGSRAWLQDFVPVKVKQQAPNLQRAEAGIEMFALARFRQIITPVGQHIEKDRVVIKLANLPWHTAARSG